jgi:hypothetical protein
MQLAVFWDAAQCSLVDTDRRFRGTYCLHYQGPDVENYHNYSPEKENYYYKLQRSVTETTESGH